MIAKLISWHPEVMVAFASSSLPLPDNQLQVDRLDTPVVLVHRDTLVRNINRVASAVSAKGLALRPHVKTHKIAQIADLQLGAGAVGITVATISEAEVFAAHGVADIFIAYPLWLTAHKADRIRRLARSTRFSLGVDSVESAQHTGAVLGPDAASIEVLIEIDSGHHRSGVLPQNATQVAAAVAEAGLKLGGVFTFPGHSYAPGQPQAVALQEHDSLATAARLLRAAGFHVDRISGGSTPTALLTDSAEITEVRPGVYVFGDAQQLELARCELNDIALTVAATVVSRHDDDGAPRRVVLDAGSKILGSDRPAWATGFGRIVENLDARITALSEHHATVEWPEGAELPPMGTRLMVIPNHVCLVLNLVDQVVVIEDGRAVDVWDVVARGCNT